MVGDKIHAGHITGFSLYPKDRIEKSLYLKDNEIENFYTLRHQSEYSFTSFFTTLK